MQSHYKSIYKASNLVSRWAKEMEQIILNRKHSETFEKMVNS